MASHSTACSKQLDEWNISKEPQSDMQGHRPVIWIMQPVWPPNQPERQKVLEDFLQRQAARVLGMDPARLDLDQPSGYTGSQFAHGNGTQEFAGIEIGNKAFDCQSSTGTDHFQSRRRSAWESGFDRSIK